MRRHRAAIVAAGLEHHRRPEVGDLRDVMIPVLNLRVEDRADQVVGAGAGIKRRHKPRDVRLGQVGMERVNRGRCLRGHGADVGRRSAAGNHAALDQDQGQRATGKPSRCAFPEAAFRNRWCRIFR